MAFSNPIIGGDGVLVREKMRSTNFVSGSAGWQISADGNAEFNDIVARGRIEVGATSEPQVIIDADPVTHIGYVSMPTNSLRANYSPVILSAVGNAGLANENNSLQMQGPSVDGATDRLLWILSSQNNDATSQANAVLRLASGATLISSDKNVTTVGNRLVCNDFAHAQSNAVGSAVANVNIGAGPSGYVTICSVTITGVAGREYEIDANWYGVLPGAASADLFSFRIYRDTTALQTQRRRSDATNSTQLGGHMTVTDTPGAGSFTYSLQVNHEGGAGVAVLSAATTAPAIIKVKGFA